MEHFDFVDDFVYQRNQYRSDWKVRVKIVRIWNTDSMFGQTIEMVVCDERGARARVTILPPDVPKYRSVVREGDWSIFCCFSVKEDTTYGSRPTSPPMKIQFLSHTTVLPCETVVDSLFLQNERFFDIIDRSIDSQYLIDVIGVVHRVGELVEFPCDNGFVGYNFRFELIDDRRNIVLPCTTRGCLAKNFYDSVKSIQNEPIVCALRFWSVADGKGVDKNSVVLTSATDISDFILNPDDQDCREFLHRYLGD